jgi:stage II sporulation protein D
MRLVPQVVCAFALSFVSFPAFAKDEPLVVRGLELDTPFRVRILVKSFEAGRIEVSGHELRDERGRLVGGESLRCVSQRKLVSFKEKIVWSCQGGNYRRVLDGPSRFEPLGGFVEVNGDLFRGAVDLVPQRDRLLLINELDLSSYLAGLVNKEMRSDFPPEAVKAQVVAARSYALATAADRRRQGSPFDMHSTEADQVYAGTGSEDSKAHRLVREVANEVLFHREEILKAYYHSSSGGRSELPSNVWGPSRDETAYLARESPADLKLDVDWSVVLSPSMGLRWPEIGRIKSVRVLERSGGSRVKKIEIAGEKGTAVWSGAELRSRLGPRWLKSTDFRVEATSQGWRLNGRGWGHGVGLSQLGAREMAREGKSYREILRHYYPYSNVRRVPVEPAPALRSPVQAR